MKCERSEHPTIALVTRRESFVDNDRTRQLGEVAIRDTRNRPCYEAWDSQQGRHAAEHKLAPLSFHAPVQPICSRETGISRDLCSLVLHIAVSHVLGDNRLPASSASPHVLCLRSSSVTSRLIALIDSSSSCKCR